MADKNRGYGPLDNHMYMYDLGWLVKTILGFQEELDTAIDLKTIHYADPIQWDITTQYSPNTVVVDPKTGTAYMSKVPVPAGIQLDNTDYWVVIFNYQRIYDKIMSGVAFNDKENLEASKDISKHDFVWFGGDLYQAQRDLPQGSKYIPGVNIVATTIADALATYYGRDRVAQVINDTLTASETQTVGAKNRVITVTEDQTVTAGDIAETSANRTIKTTADYHIDVDGNLSDHVDGVTTVNRGGAVTEAYGSSLDVNVTGTYTADYSGDVTETYKGERNVTGKGINLTASENITASTNQFDLTSAAKTFPVRFPDKVVDLYNLDAGVYTTPDKFGARGDGITDDTAAFTRMLTESNKNIVLEKGKIYIINELTITKPVIIDLNGSTLKTSTVNTCVIVQSHCIIKNGNIVTDLTYNDGGNGIKIEVNGSRTIIENVYINGFVTGIYCDRVSDILINHCTTLNHVYLPSIKQGGYNILLEKSSNITIINCNLSGGANNRHCIYISDGNENVNITGCLFNMTQFVDDKEPIIYIRDNKMITITNNIFHGGTYSLFISGTTKGCENIIVSNNTFDNIVPKGESENGKYIVVTLSEDQKQRPKNVTITGNLINNTANNPTAIFVIGENVAVTGNAIRGQYNRLFELYYCQVFLGNNSLLGAICTNKEISVKEGVLGEINGYHGKIENLHTGALYMELNFNNEIKININNSQIKTQQIVDYATVSFAETLLNVQLNTFIINREHITAYITPYNNDGKYELFCNWLGGGIFRFTVVKDGTPIDAKTFIGNITIRI